MKIYHSLGSINFDLRDRLGKTGEEWANIVRTAYPNSKRVAAKATTVLHCILGADGRTGDSGKKLIPSS